MNPQPIRLGIAVVLGAAIIHAAAVGASAQTAGLRIVVIQGEDAVNIVQQKTAVNPIVEVRDRNNLPVSGVAVTFSVGGQGASFAGGASTLTLTTNAAGQAVVTGLTPTATGAVTINATAVVQGQTIAATITQTNFATAAQAAAAASGGTSGASAGGATAGGGGGGISATTIGIIGAAVGGGALAATQLTKDDEAESDTESFSGTFSGDLVFTFGTGASACTRLERHAGTLRVDLADLSGLLSGSTAEIRDGVATTISTTCPGGPQPGQTQTFGMPKTTVNGTRPIFGFAEQFSAPSVDGSGTLVLQIYDFTGVRTGDSYTGTLIKAVRLELSSNLVAAGLFSAAVTLTRSR